MNTLLDLVDAVKDSGSEHKIEYFDIIEETAEAFLSFSGNISAAVQADVLEQDPAAQAERKKAEEQLGTCIARCEDLNRIAKDIGFDLYVDVSDRRKVEQFVGESLHTAYERGIHNREHSSF
jgi:hypothetical protein